MRRRISKNGGHDPAMIAKEKRLAQLYQDYNDLWKARSKELRQQTREKSGSRD